MPAFNWANPPDTGLPFKQVISNYLMKFGGEENVLILPSFMGNICTIIFYIIYLLPLFNSTITTLIKKYIYKTQSHTILVYGHDGLWYMLFHLENGNQR